MAEEYFTFKDQIIKVNNMKEVDFKKIALKVDDEDQRYFVKNNYLIDQDNVYFNKESVNLLKYKIQFLGKVKSGKHKVPFHNNSAYKSLSIDLDKGLDLLKKYQKNNHEQASFLHYKSDLLDYYPQARKEFILKLAAEAAELGYNLYLVGVELKPGTLLTQLIQYDIIEIFIF